MNSKIKSFLVFLGILVVMAIVLFFFTWHYFMGVDGYGPYRNVDTAVNRTYIDHSGEGSHYMVGTDAGVYEVDNGWLLGVTNADEIYSKIREGHKYHLVTKGNKLVWYFGIQHYPYITKVEEVK